MQRLIYGLWVGAVVCAAAVGPQASGAMKDKHEKTVMVGGAAMFPSKDIIDNAVNSKDHTTLVAAVKAAGLVETLKGKGPFTVFAPTNAAFGALPAGTVDTLLKPENKATLTRILTYHVVPGKLDLARAGGAGQGQRREGDAQNGERRNADRDDEGRRPGSSKTKRAGTTMISIPNVYQSNGVIHVISAVAMPSWIALHDSIAPRPSASVRS